MIKNLEELDNWILSYSATAKKDFKKEIIICDTCAREKRISLYVGRSMSKFGHLRCARCRQAETMLKTLGYSNVWEREDVKKQIIETNIKKYGKDCYKQRTKKGKQTKLERYGDENYCNIEAIKEKARLRSEEEKKAIVRKTKQTKLERYGDENYLNIEKRENTCLKKYGVKNFVSTEKFRQKFEETQIKNYGSLKKFYNHVRRKTDETNLRRYGCERPVFRSLYRYDDKNFDSSWELAYYIYLKQNKIVFELKPEKIEYFDDNGKSYYYYPDFKIGDQLVEIKGGHLIDSEGNLRTPYGTDNELKNKAKTKLLKELNVKILRWEDLPPSCNIKEARKWRIHGRQII
jgi:hypothetical protein